MLRRCGPPVEFRKESADHHAQPAFRAPVDDAAVSCWAHWLAGFGHTPLLLWCGPHLQRPNAREAAGEMANAPGAGVRRRVAA